jgi:hypothetical protein
MKSIKEIEKMSLEQLEAVSMDETIAVPEGFAIRLKENLGAAETIGLLTENESGSQSAGKMARYAAAAASVAILAGAGLGISRWQSEPKDTFDDPYMAYAELEKAFAKMSGGMQKALAMAEESEAALDKVVSVFE